MALSVSELQAVSSTYFDKTLTEQVYDSSVLLAKLKAKNKIIVDGGKDIQFPIRYQELGLAESTGWRDQITFEGKETRTGGVLDWTNVVARTTIHWDEKNKNGGKAQIVNLVKEKSKELKEDMDEKLNDLLYATTQATNAIQGLANIVDSATSYAGIAVSDVSEWAGIEDSSTTTLTIGKMRYLRHQAMFNRYFPNLYITTYNILDKYEALAMENKTRYEDVDTANLGFDNVTFYKKPVVGDPHCPSTYMYGLDLDSLELWVHENNNFKVGKWFELNQAGFIEATAKVMTFSGNLVCRRRKTNFKWSSIVYTE